MSFLKSSSDAPVDEKDIVDDEGFHLLLANLEDHYSIWVKELASGGIDVKVITDIEPYLKQAEEGRKETAGKRWGEGQVVGSLPMTIAKQTGYLDALHAGDDAWKKKFWNSGDYSKFRTKEGRV